MIKTFPRFRCVGGGCSWSATTDVGSISCPAQSLHSRKRRDLVERCASMLRTLLLLAPLLYLSAPAQGQQAAPLKMHWWWSRSSMAEQILDRAREFDLHTIILENDQRHTGWGDI